ncbi:MAG: DUF1801 domain-containing protein [Acidobacteria bacterium]|nr:DUF1801 domain-containing protein [Acidobacteriota bacterium]MBV8892010.1 DUF1801 domain-containing protein [Acidobacteriota bacterium]MBV9480195.1 DUF1801 domain-containing protein [Acidobacteriota bacterium]
MKKPAVKARSRKKTRGAPKTVDQYIAAIPEAARTTFNTLRAAVRSAVPPDAAEILSYGIPAFKTRRVLVWFAAFSKHSSLFPSAAVIACFSDELKGFAVSKGTIQFPNGRPVPRALVKKLVRARVAQSE